MLLFNNAAHPNRAARIHAAHCPLAINTASRKGRRTAVQAITDFDQEMIDDLDARGFPVKRCRCCKGT